MRGIFFKLPCRRTPNFTSRRQIFSEIREKNQTTFTEAVKTYDGIDKNHVQFIYDALRNMDQFHVAGNLKAYKMVADVLPKGKFIPENLIQAEFMHYPRQQQCIIDLLEQMEENHVMPDEELGEILVKIFGKHGYPLRKLWRMMYWMSKFKKLTPWPLPDDLPNDLGELTKLGITRISDVDQQTKVKQYLNENKWIVSAQSKTQKKLLQNYHESSPLYIQGPYKIHLRDKSINYFVLKGNSNKTAKTIHEQEDGIVFAVCSTETSCKTSLKSWLSLLENDGNQKLGKLSVEFCLRDN